MRYVVQPIVGFDLMCEKVGVARSVWPAGHDLWFAILLFLPQQGKNTKKIEIQNGPCWQLPPNTGEIFFKWDMLSSKSLASIWCAKKYGSPRPSGRQGMICDSRFYCFHCLMYCYKVRLGGICISRIRLKVGGINRGGLMGLTHGFFLPCTPGGAELGG